MIRLARLVPGPLLAVTATVTAFVVLRRRSLQWGATGRELRGRLPGDDLLSHADLCSTRAITIRSSPENVWPWVAQLGQGRGGFYSYDFLENLLGCGIHSANTIEDRWQVIAAGDEVRLHPELSLVVSKVEPGRALVLRGGVPMGPMSAPYEMTWAFVVQDGPPESVGTTRLLVRERYQYRSWWAPLLVEPVELASLVMSQRMLRGIKQRAERAMRTAAALPASLEASHG